MAIKPAQAGARGWFLLPPPGSRGAVAGRIVDRHAGIRVGVEGDVGDDPRIGVRRCERIRPLEGLPRFGSSA